MEMTVAQIHSGYLRQYRTQAQCEIQSYLPREIGKDRLLVKPKANDEVEEGS